MHTLVAPSINLIILIGVLFYYLRAPLTEFVANRSQSVRAELDAVRGQLSSAKREYEEFSQKLAALSSEVVELRAQALSDMAKTKTQIVENAKKLSVNIIADSKTSANALYSDLKGQLYADLSGQVLERAEKILRERLTGDDRVRIQKEFSSQLERTQ